MKKITGHKWYHDSSHVVWRIGTIFSVTLLIVMVNYFNAKQFDKDDLERVAELLLGLGVLKTMKDRVLPP